jgi:methyl-accepting chemotaxis protein
MKGFANLSIRTKLLLGFALIVALLILVAAVAFRGITTIRERQKILYDENFSRVIDVMDVRFNQAKIRLDEMSEILVSDRASIDSFIKDSDDRTKTVDALVQKLLAAEADNPKRLASLQQLDAMRKAFTDTRDTQFIPFILSGKTNEAKTIVMGIQADRNSQINAIVDGLVTDAENEAGASYTASQLAANQSILLFVTVGIAAVILAAAAALVLNRSISSPLKEISRAAQKIASGDLTVEVSTNDRRDEVGTLGESFHAMVAGLRDMNREIGQGVNVLASSANEILATATQLGASASETAAAMSQTTATAEEVRQTAQLSGQKAKYVSESAQKAAQVSQAGKRAVEDTIQGMSRIKEQVGSIAENIVRLSEQSQAIAEIAGTVSDLAGQVNLLAVNASIEASKAGEQGKGFLVVAQEVKGLSVQAKQATVQVRSILNEVQKAVSAAVMATEQGGRIVEAGSEQALRAGESIQALAETIAESAQAAVQVAASSQQQQAGMDQLAAAMENIRQASAQNAEGAKQTEGAAKNLHDLGQDLKRLVERFKVPA